MGEAAGAPRPYPMKMHIARQRRQPKPKATEGKLTAGWGVGYGRGEGRLARSALDCELPTPIGAEESALELQASGASHGEPFSKPVTFAILTV